MAVLSAGVLPLGWKFCVAPPLLVALQKCQKIRKTGEGVRKSQFSSHSALQKVLCAAC